MNRVRLCVVSIREKSLLAEKLRETTGDTAVKRDHERYAAFEKDASGEPFRELFVMPRRKLRGQLQIEQATGRSELVQNSRTDIHDRLAVRRPRAEQMSPEQDWTNVWPAARSFAASVVPLPIRMGYRRKPDKRAPFKKFGNLELVKIPNFLHLTPAAIEKHCNAIKKFMTPYPPELLANASLADSELPITVSYATYVHQGTNIRDMRSRVVTLKVKVNALCLDEHAREKLLRLAGRRYDEKENVLTILTDRCHTRKQNLDYAYYLLTVLYHESQKIEKWEELKIREDNIRVLFEGSHGEKQLVSLLEKVITNPKFNTPLKELGDKATPDKILQHEKVKDFAQTWFKYRNTPETVESAREYGLKVRELLGLPRKVEPETETSQSS